VIGAAVDSTGQVGVLSSGTFPASQVIIAMPAYLDLTASSTTITSASSM